MFKITKKIIKYVDTFWLSNLTVHVNETSTVSIPPIYPSIALISVMLISAMGEVITMITFLIRRFFTLSHFVPLW